MVSSFGNLNGSGNQQVWVYVARTGQSGRQSHYNYEVRYYGNGYGSWGSGPGSWSFSCPYASSSGSWTISSGDAYDTYTVLKKGSFSATHNSSGNLAAFTVTASINYSSHSSIGSGSASATEPAPPRIATAPAQVTGLTISSITDEGAYLDWNAPSNNGSSITGYDIQYSKNSDFSSGTVKAVSTTTAYTMTGLTAGTKYYFRVRAKNADGAGSYSSSVNALLKPAAPTGLALSAFTEKGMKLDWADTTSATGYDIRYDDNSGYSSPSDTTSTSSDKTFTNLPGGSRYWFKVRAKNATGAGDYSGSVNNITVPVVPAGLVLSAPSTTGMTATWTKGSNGSEVASYDVTYSTSSSFPSGSATVTVNTTALTKALTGLNPGTTYYVKVRAKNANGTGAYTSAVSQVTLPAVAPGLTVKASADGKSATLTFTPPGGVTGVDKYDWDRRVQGQTTETHGSTAAGATSVTVSGLTPGTTYEWRGSAWIGTYESPLTAWIALLQPKPNTSPGDYFDGATVPPAGSDVTYSWSGTAHASTSLVTGKGVAGWRAYFTAPGSGTLSQVTGGHSHTYAARVTFNSDTTTELGLNAGNAAPDLAAVVGDGEYVGSMWVRPSRDQLMHLRIHWYDAAQILIPDSDTIGSPVMALAGEWTELRAVGGAPDGALWASVRARDGGGAGWTPFRGGEFVDLDDSMVTLAPGTEYFDGAYPDTPDYRYDWLGTAHASASTRTTLDASQGYDPLNDPECEDIPEPPRPPVVPADCIDEIGVWRRYWVSIPAESISDWLEVIPTITVTSGRGTAEPEAPLGVNQVRIRVYENPDDLAIDAFPATEWVSEQIISYMPPYTKITIDGVSQRAWAEVDGAPARPADKLLYGTGGIPATWPVLSCGIGYLVSFDTPLDVLLGNVVPEMALTERMG